MKAFLLAAGLGERLRPLTDHTPKSLISVMNVPVIAWALTLIKDAGIHDLAINHHYLGDQIVKFIEDHDGFGLNITFFHEKEILGTGGGIKNIENWIGDDAFITINSDVVSDIDLKNLISHHQSSDRGGMLTLYQTDQAARIGHVHVKDGRVIGFKNPDSAHVSTGYIYTGIGLFSPEIFQYLKQEKSNVVTTGYTNLIKNEGLGFYSHPGFWYDIGTHKQYWDAHIRFGQDALSIAEKMKHHLGLKPQPIHPLAKWDDSTIITESIVGHGVTIGADCQITRSIILPGTTIENGTMIENAIINSERTLKVLP